MKRCFVGWKLRASVCLVAGLVLGMGLASGCGAATDGGNAAQGQGQPQGTKADLELDLNKSVYPYLVFFNQGSAKAEEVHVTEAKSGAELVPLGLLQKSGNTVAMQPAPKPLTVDPGAGAQIQLNNKDLREYKVTWKEGGHAFSKELVMKEQQKIETH